MTIFNSWEEAEEAFYKVNDCNSDDSDKEGARVERWVENCGHEVHEEEHTMKEWEEIKKESKVMKNPIFKVKHFGSRWYDYEITIPRKNGETIISGLALLNESVEIGIKEQDI